MKTSAGALKYAELLILITIWVAILMVPFLIFQRDDTVVWESVFIAWMGVLPFFLLFLINHFLLIPFLLFKNNKLFYLLSVIFLLMMFSFSTFYLERNRMETKSIPYPGIHPPPQAMQPNHNPQPGPPARQQQRGRPIPFPPLVNTIILSVLVIGFDTGLRLIVRWTKLEQEKTILQKENIQNQLAFLRNQVSPHFFMNTLNNIHALIDINAEEAKTAIIKLSKLMRHLLYDADTDFTPLKKEVEFIKSYINLMMLRFPEKVKITLDIADDLPDRQIPPLLYTSLIENAFKHGISYTSNSFIHIRLSFSGNRLLFEIRNSNPHFSGKHASESIGLENTRKRLDLIYHDKYDFEITRNEEIFAAKLSIPL